MDSSQVIRIILLCFVSHFATVCSAGDKQDHSLLFRSNTTDCCTNPDQGFPPIEVAYLAQTDKPVVALILARGGSKGIPLKNLRTIGGESLLARSLRVTKESGVFNDIWVSTDHDGIAREAILKGATVHRRPANVSGDTTPSIVSVQEFLNHHPEFQRLALIQCTSAFLRAAYLKEAFRKIQTADCVFAVVRSWKLRWQPMWDDSSPTRGLVPLNFDSNRRPRRQDWPGELLETGMFYFARRELLEMGRFQNDKCSYIEIAAEDALEVDTPIDLDMAKCIVEHP